MVYKNLTFCIKIFLLFLFNTPFIEANNNFNVFFNYAKDSALKSVDMLLGKKSAVHTTILSPWVVDTIMKQLPNGKASVLVVGNYCPSLIRKIMEHLNAGSIIDCICYNNERLDAIVDQGRIKNIVITNHVNWQRVEKKSSYYDYVFMTTILTPQLPLPEIERLFTICSSLLTSNGKVSYMLPVSLFSRGSCIPVTSLSFLEWIKESLIFLEKQDIKNYSHQLIAEKNLCFFCTRGKQNSINRFL